jgi:hypothetical protein
MEGYGLVSFFLSLQAIISLLVGTEHHCKREIGSYDHEEMASRSGHCCERELLLGVANLATLAAVRLDRNH